MKDKPTELDREAGRLFVPAPGARSFVDGRWVRIGTDDFGLDEDRLYATDAHSALGVDAFDTDDPATVGIMLAQVEAACGQGAAVGLLDMRRLGNPPAEQFVVLMGGDAVDKRAAGPTRGAALVEAMRAIKAVQR